MNLALVEYSTAVTKTRGNRNGANDSAVDAALKRVRSFIVELRKSFERGPDPEGTVHAMSFFTARRGGFGLTRDEHATYRACIDAFMGLHGQNPDKRIASRRTAEKALQDAMLRALRPGRGTSNDPRPRFIRRLDAVMRDLRSDLTRVPDSWDVALKIHGLTKHPLPLTLGSVRFERATPTLATELTTRVTEWQPQRRTSKARIENENALRTDLRAKIAKQFVDGAVASTSVAALDAAAAQRLGTEKIRRTVDVLNFFAPFFDLPRSTIRVYVPPEGERERLTWLVTRRPGPHLSYNDEPALVRPLSKFSTTSRMAKRYGVTRVHEMLSRDTPSPYDDRLITAIAWAGRARVEHRRDQAFLLYAIALEGLLSPAKSRAAVTDRLRLRVARVLGLKPSGRRKVYELMGRLYELRSFLVHTGTAATLNDEDLALMERVTENCLLTVLTERRFKDIRDEQSFEAWFEQFTFA